MNYSGPKLHVVLTRVSPNKSDWEVTLRAPDSSGLRELGYKASGHLEDGGDPVFEAGPQVHDEHRPVWTTMNPGDRPDIRNRILQLVKTAAAKMMVSQQQKFEHLIK